MKLLEISQKICGKSHPELSGNIYCVGRNYVAHAKELGNQVPSEPVVFLKAPSSLRTWEFGDTGFASEDLHHELELVLLVKNYIPMGGKAQESDISGISLGCDLTRREVQTKLKNNGLPWAIAKSFKGSAIIGEFCELKTSILTKGIEFDLFINDKQVQHGNSSLMIFDFNKILNYLLGFQDLFAGDLIFTGTPEGVGVVRNGDHLRVTSTSLGLEFIGKL